VSAWPAAPGRHGPRHWQGQPALSQQLAALRRADVVDTRRDGKQIFYRLSNETVAACVNNIGALFGESCPAETAPPVIQSRAPRRGHPSVPAPAGAAAFTKLL